MRIFNIIGCWVQKTRITGHEFRIPYWDNLLWKILTGVCGRKVSTSLSSNFRCRNISRLSPSSCAVQGHFGCHAKSGSWGGDHYPSSQFTWISSQRGSLAYIYLLDLNSVQPSHWIFSYWILILIWGNAPQCIGYLHIFWWDLTGLCMQEGFLRLWRGLNASLAISIPTVSFLVSMTDIYFSLMILVKVLSRMYRTDFYRKYVRTLEVN